MLAATAAAAAVVVVRLRYTHILWVSCVCLCVRTLRDGAKQINGKWAEAMRGWHFK